jgi:hypothetical protein
VQILIHVISRARWLVVVLAFGTAFQVRSESLSAPEYKIKAAFLYNFAVLTRWPSNALESAKSPFVIGVYGKDPFGRVLEETVRGKTIHGRKIEIARFKETNELSRCHLLFISLSEENQIQSILSSLGNRPVLTVSEIDRFNFHGGIIWLKKEGAEIKFQIRLASARKSGLVLSSKMLRLSTNAGVRKENP